MELSQMSPRRPYLLRAHYEWLLDNDMTPHLVIDVTLRGVNVPMEYARDGQIVLNIAPRAVGNLELTNDEVRFNARFGGVPRRVNVPMAAVIAIYGRENGAGMMFEPEAAYKDEYLFKSASDQDKADTSASATDNLVLVTDALPGAGDDSGASPDDEPPKPTRGRPALRVVK
ncbi:MULTISPECIES: ClpXP protease specificity-enhancing factor [Photorhabdus]|uniref:Stringent starvation protein B n=1 Tax=Photorhabdus bodei TaxID=2029681 RepID=A0A329X8A7_9GAMM|nr:MULTISPECIES: ClpXP protease specificity-enhancing factor [Photorhabdus]MCT8342607.1 ClpXP protease specificity-enhancing factor [Photorhabdus kleinii]NDL00101.1 ClpXP protease specificity-enhancing factor [Photorhabdus bodei]NDL04236.1 ClpXP protease specificity-enhancing factor [Photorhabdus bodei]NDL08517.1 ClpXP protease specificity-enhancing factor [Photorhabdus bodei]RAW95490.1 ClpXP protease specificity-enhancing factor [Photorhabdus sp. S9-53]